MSASQFEGQVPCMTEPTWLTIKTAFNCLCQEAMSNAKERGFWSKGPSLEKIPQALCLMHSEISEALEEYRKPFGNIQQITLNQGKPVGFPIELADLLIRVFDTAAAFEINLAEAIRIKMEYNRTRPHRHGDKRC